METANVVLAVSNDDDLKSMHTPSMASSSGEQRSFWASNVEHALRIMREELDTDRSEFRILKVPEGYRKPAADYTPEVWRFGLHNRDENEVAMSESEAAKRAVVVLLGLDEESKWTSFCDAVVPDPKAMWKCYGLHKEVNDLVEAEIKQVLAFDALFLAFRMETEDSIPWESCRLVSRKLWESVRFFNFWQSFRGCYDMVFIDVCKIENQLPFDLIKRAIDHVEKLTSLRKEDTVDLSDEGNVQVHEQACLESWMKAAVLMGMQEFMTISDDFYKGANASQKLSESHHILAAAYQVICGVDGMKRKSDYSTEDYIHVPSATRLKESGVRITGVAGPLSCMAFDKKTNCFSLPKMKIFDRTVAVVRNIAKYEGSLWYDNSMLHDYVFLMLDLIETPSDLKHLVKCGVVYNGCGTKGFDTWREVDEHLPHERSSTTHNEMKRDINKRCKLRRHSLWSEFRTLFLSRPWLTLSAVAITLVTLATLIQTYATVINTNGMKPQFNP